MKNALAVGRKAEASDEERGPLNEKHAVFCVCNESWCCERSHSVGWESGLSSPRTGEEANTVAKSNLIACLRKSLWEGKREGEAGDSKER